MKNEDDFFWIQAKKNIYLVPQLMKEQRKTIYLFLYYQRNEDKPKYLFLNYRRNIDEAEYLFLNYRRNEDKPKYLFLNYRRNKDEAKYLFLNYQWFDIASFNSGSSRLSSHALKSSNPPLTIFLTKQWCQVVCKELYIMINDLSMTLCGRGDRCSEEPLFSRGRQSFTVFLRPDWWLSSSIYFCIIFLLKKIIKYVWALLALINNWRSF